MTTDLLADPGLLAYLQSYVSARVRDHAAAEDITNEVFARATRYWSSFDPERGNLRAWLTGIARRRILDWAAADVGEVLTPWVDETVRDPDSQREFELAEDRVMLDQLLRQTWLGDLDRRLLRLVADGMSVAAIERETGISARTIGRRLDNLGRPDGPLADFCAYER